VTDSNASASHALRVLLVDDEALARLRLRTLLADCSEPGATVVGEAVNAAQALEWLHAACTGSETDHRACDLVLLDVQMPGRDGTQLAEELRALHRPPAVVFVTAHASHALKAFDLEAVDYLTKPVRRERLQLALQRVAARLAPVVSAVEPAVQPDPVLVVSERGRVVRVPLAEVLYLKAELKYVTLRTAAHTHVLDDALSDLEQRLGPRFLRVHRNALVARSAISALERRTLADKGNDGDEAEDGPASDCWAVKVAPVGEWLAVSRRQATAVREALAASGL
jgi:two-component system response regulator AlgR